MGKNDREGEQVKHKHNFKYGDVPGLGECKCGAYKVWNRQTQAYEEYEKEKVNG